MSPLILDSHLSTTPPHTHSLPTSRHRTFTLLPAKPTDVRRLVDIEFHAFENERVNQLLSYRDHKKPAHFERSVKQYLSLLSQPSTPTLHVLKRKREARRVQQGNVQFKKIVHNDSGEVVSFTKYEMKEYGLDELRSPCDQGHEGEPQMNRDWFALNERLRREYIGTARHCYIGMLATEPAHQHHGAGTLLLEEILAEADDAGVAVYLEATDTAKPLYERHGFEAITELRFDPAEYGLEGVGVERQTVMVRGAMGSGGERMAVRRWDEVVE